MQKFLQAILLVLLASVLCQVPAFAEAPSLADQTQQEKLRAEGIRQYDVPIHEQPTDWLISEFKDQRTREGHSLNAALAMRNIIWQQRQLHVQGKVPPIRGNIRTFGTRTSNPF